MKLIDVTRENVSEKGFFCLMSRRKAAGYQRKLEWLEARFAEGMRIKLLDLSMGGRGFIEYLPGEYAWRAVEARGYMVIHCHWVVGKCKGKGYGKLLLNACIKDARKKGMKGMAAVTGGSRWLVEKSFLEEHGFESVDTAPPAFDLMVKRFGRARPPTFSGGWEAKQKKCGPGLTIFRSDQCPYLEDAVSILEEAAKERKLKTKVIDLPDCDSVRRLSPSPYGVFNIVYDGALLNYHYLTEREFLKQLDRH